MQDRLATRADCEQKQAVFELFARHVSTGKVDFFHSAGIDFVQGRRSGPYVWDLDGEKRLIDCHCNGGVFNLGHRNPEILQALVDSLQELDIGNHHLISTQRARLALTLARLAPGDLPYTVFGVGGGEAIDLAIKVARGYTGKRRIISAQGGYHGHTGFALAAGDAKYRDRFGPMTPGFVQVPFNDLSALEAALDADTAAVLLETIPATLGIAIPVSGYFPGVRQLCDRHAVLLIVDEVQSGLGRTGRLWAIEHFGVTPDILVTGKGLSGGIYPLSATCFKAELEAVFHQDPFVHISTFGGAEVGCPVGLKVLEISAEPAFLAHVEQMAGCFAKGFQELQQRHPYSLVRLRQLGLMMGVEMVHPACGLLFTQAAYENGLLAVYANNDPRIAQLLPPLTCDEPLVAEILERTDRALTGVERKLAWMGIPAPPA